MNLRFGSLIALGMTLAACNEVETELTVEDVPQRLSIQLQGERGLKEYLPGDYKVRLKFSNDSKSPSKLEVLDGDNLQVADLYAISFSELQELQEPLTLTSDKIRQPFNLRIERVISEGDDHYSVIFSDPEENIPNAHLSFSADGKDNQVDASTGEFLASYQKVRFSKRGIMYGIDYAIDHYPFPHGELLDDLAHFAAVLLIAPWVYARYSTVVWTIQDDSWDYDWLVKGWTKLFKNSPVVDFVGAYHSGLADSVLAPTLGLPKKRNQLRLFYTEGCNTGSSMDMLLKYNFAASIGYRAYSVSPLFTFSTVRQWVYGHDLAEALKRASQAGHENVDFWTYDFLRKLWLDAYGYTPYASAEDLHYQTEPLVAWTDETVINKMKITLSATPKRETSETQIPKQTDAFSIRHLGAETAIQDNAIANLEAYIDGY